MNQNKEIWNKAKRLIPSGTQLLSKRQSIYSSQWPTHFRKAKGVNIWDMDNKKYTDVSSMGIGTCILGYADEYVNSKVKKIIDRGSMSSLNPPEEIELAEKLLFYHHWADMIRYTRTGGEAMAVAIRIARAFTEKNKIAVCSYSGWHDWYISANLANRHNLDNHLLPFLNPLGIPNNLINTCIPFTYNKIEELENIIETEDIGTIVIEPIRYENPKNNFLQKVREIASNADAVLIFDEITSGYRMNPYGVHIDLNIIPDIVVYGKAISNGFPMSAIIGKKEVMEIAQECFISSTYWTERIGPTAALATIKKMELISFSTYMKNLTNFFANRLKKLNREFQLNLNIKNAIPSLISFDLIPKQRTYFIEEMLKRNYLATNNIYLSSAHSFDIINNYFENITSVFEKFKNDA